MNRVASVTTVCLLATVITAGCGRDASGGDTAMPVTPSSAPATDTPAGPTPFLPPEPAPTPEPSISEPTRPVESPANTTPNRSRSSPWVKWIKKFTPTGGGGTSAEAAYTSYMRRDCRTTWDIARATDLGQTMEPLEEPLRSLYQGAAAACLAAFHDRSELWDTAIARSGRINQSDLDCWNRSVYEILIMMVEAYRAAPNAVFRIAKGETSPCPVLTRLKPDHGPREGGVKVEVEGKNLPMKLELLWGHDEIVTARRAGPEEPLLLDVPAATSDEPDVVVDVKIAAAPRIEPVYASFRYDE